MNEFLLRVVGCDTVSVRSFNIAQCAIILVAATFYFFGLPVTVPSIIDPVFPIVAASSFFGVFTGVMSFILSKKNIMKSRIVGAISLIFGVIINAILAGSAYVNFPPFDTLMITAPLLIAWYSLAILYIFEVEGYDIHGFGTVFKA